MKYLDKTDESCSIIGAVNTVVNNDGVLKGYNTDMDGFLEPLKKRNISIQDKKILLIGAGGAARAIIAGMSKEKAQEVDIANRTTKNAEELSEFATSIGLSTNVKKIEEVKNLQKYNVIINSTSLGLKDEPSPILFEHTNENVVIYDIVYSPMNTDFIKKAKNKKLEVIYGYEMLLGQATRAFEIWHGMKAPYNAMKKALLGGF
jgi:shikimate dehydrogenase